MTIIRFTYSAGYHRPATGGVVFMPHRKHAANETVVLPRPFTRPLVDGVVEVDLEPTSDDWLWSVTHDHDTRFYAIPDTDGVIDHTDLIPVAPSTLTHRIEPVWWAELRQYKTTVADTLVTAGDALREAQRTITTSEASQEQTRENATRGKAYMEQSRQYSYDAEESAQPMPIGFSVEQYLTFSHVSATSLGLYERIVV